MSRFAKQALGLIALLLSIGASGCNLSGVAKGLAFERLAIRYDIAEDLSGTATFELAGAHHQADVRPYAERTRSLCSLLDMNRDWWRNFGAQNLSALGLHQEVQATLESEPDSSCSVRISGRFENFARLEWIQDSMHVEPSGDRLVLRLDPEQVSSETDTQHMDAVLSIRYAGRVLAQNAHSLDPETGRLEWKANRPLPAPQIHLELALGPEARSQL